MFLSEFPLGDTDNPCAPVLSAVFSVVVSTTNRGCDLEVATVVIKPEESVAKSETSITKETYKES